MSTLIIPKSPGIIKPSGIVAPPVPTRRDLLVPATRWKRDPGISELIQYFDQPKYIIKTPNGSMENWEAVSNSDWELICREAERCQKDFIYAAKNYFWITNKQTGDQLFTLWESQEMILEKILEIRARGVWQKLIVLKARQMGISTLCEALIAWGTMFNPNVNANVVGPERNRSEYLFSIMLHIYDQMPWWLRPMCSNREYAGGLVFDNPDPDQRRLYPGLRSRIEVQMASQYAGVGQGLRLNLAHISELADFADDRAREMVEADLGNALAENAMTLAIIESTAKGAGRYYHELYKGNKEAGENAGWVTIFIPAFMEKSRVMAPQQGWRMESQEEAYRDAVKDAWVQCDNADCGRWKESKEKQISWRDVPCPYCHAGTLRAFVLSDQQVRYMEYRRKDAELTGYESVKKFRQEIAVTETDAFQLSGDPVFPEDTISFAATCIRNPIMEGYLDENGNLHAVHKVERDNRGNPTKFQCFQLWCSKDHRFDTGVIRIWETPLDGHEYAMGVDVAEGLGGRHDYSVISINRIGKGLNPDVQVAVWRSNTVNHYDLAIPVIQLGKWYNWALAAIEYNTYTTCADDVRVRYNYPHLYRWKNLEGQNIMTTKWHWYTQMNSKTKLWGGAVRRLRAKLWHPRSRNLVDEMKTFQKDDDNDRKAGAERGFHDDELMSSLISLHCAHDTDQDETMLQRKLGPPGAAEVEKEFECECLNCRHKFESSSLPRGRSEVREDHCPECGTILIKARRKGVSLSNKVRVDLPKLEQSVDRNAIPSYDQL